MSKLTTEEAIKQLSRYDTEYYTPQCREAHWMPLPEPPRKDDAV